MFVTLFKFPDPVNEISARLVAGGVVLLGLVILIAQQPWLIAIMAYGFVARVLTGPTLSPLGQFVTRVITPALGAEPKFVPGPPKRFAQGIGATQMIMAGYLGLEQSQVRVIAADVGGGFGSKGGASPEEILVAMMARRLGGTVRWAETRSENLLAMTQGRGQIQTVEFGATADGRIVGMHMDIQQEAGAYVEIGSGLPIMTMLMSSGTYAIPKIWYTTSSWVTNTTPMGAFRGAGSVPSMGRVAVVMGLSSNRRYGTQGSRRALCGNYPGGGGYPALRLFLGAT